MAPLPQVTAAGARPPPAPNRGADLPQVESRDLLRGGHLIMIVHDGEHYYLRMTRNNKLILTK